MWQTNSNSDGHKNISSLNAPTRRKLLGALGVSAGGALAGCFGGDEDVDAQYTEDIDLEDLEMVDGQTLRLSRPVNPEKVTFLGTGAFPFPSQIGDNEYIYPPFAN